MQGENAHYKSIFDVRVARGREAEASISWVDTWMSSRIFRRQTSSPAEILHVRRLVRNFRLRQRSKRCSRRVELAAHRRAAAAARKTTDPSMACDTSAREEPRVIGVPAELAHRYDSVDGFLDTRWNPCDPADVQVLVRWKSSVVKVSWFCDLYAPKRIAEIAREKEWPEDVLSRTLEPLRQRCSRVNVLETLE